MAVGASKPTVVADADGFFSVKNKMQVSLIDCSLLLLFCSLFMELLACICAAIDLISFDRGSTNLSPCDTIAFVR